MLDLDYEVLVDDFRAQAERLLAFCGLPWDDACLAFHKTERAVTTLSVSQVRRPVYKDSLKIAERYGERLNPLKSALAGAV